MAPLPRPYSAAADAIEFAIRDGRAEDAMDQLVSALETGAADTAVQIVAAKWIATVGIKPGDPKALRGGEKASPKEWLAISEMVESLMDDKKLNLSAAAIEAAAHFGYSVRHVEECVAQYRSAQLDHRDA